MWRHAKMSIKTDINIAMVGYDTKIKSAILCKLLMFPHNDVIKWKHFLRYWPFVWGICNMLSVYCPCQCPFQCDTCYMPHNTRYIRCPYMKSISVSVEFVTQPPLAMEQTRAMYLTKSLYGKRFQEDPRGKRNTWRRHQMETFSALLALCYLEDFTDQRWIPLTKASDAELWFVFDLHLTKQLSKQSWSRWFRAPSGSLWRNCNV